MRDSCTATWLSEGVLERDAEPAAWFIAEEYTGPDGVGRERRGIVASLAAEPYETGTVLPHERTYRRTKEERLQLLRETLVYPEPLFLLVDGPLGFERPETAPEVEVNGTRLWRLPDTDASPLLGDAQLLIADGHHRYETAVAFGAEAPADENRVMALIVSTGEPGLHVFPTHRVFSGRPDLRDGGEGERVGSADEALTRLAEEPHDRSVAIAYRKDGTEIVRGREGELDVELVDRHGLDGIAYTPRTHEALAAVDSGEADAAYLLREPRRRRRLRRRATRRAHALEEHVLLPEAALRPPLPSGRPMSPWLELCRGCVADIEQVLERLPTRAEREPILRRGEGGDDTTAIDQAAEDAVVARLEDAARASSWSRRSSVRAHVRHRRAPGRRGRSDRRLREREAGHPVLLVLARSRGRADDGRRRLRLRPRLRDGRGVDGHPRRGRLPERASGSGAVRPKETIEILSFEGTTASAIAARAASVADVAGRFRVMGSLALSLCHLAAGRVDAVCSLKEARSVDIAAAQLLVRECGLSVELFEDPPFEAAPLDLVPRSRLAAAGTAELAGSVARALSA